MAPRAGRHPACRFTPSQIKRMMKQNEDIGKVAQAVPAMLGRALELFSTMLVQKAGEVTQSRGAKTLTQEHVVVVIKEDPRLDFLSHLVKGMGGEKRESGSESKVKIRDTVKLEKVKINHVDNGPKVKKRKAGKVPGEDTNDAQHRSGSKDKLSSKVTVSGLLEKEISQSVKCPPRSVTSPSSSSSSPAIQFTLQIAPVQRQFVVSEVPSTRTIAQCVEVDEDYDC